MQPTSTANAIRSARVATGQSQESAARHLGVSSRMWAHWESGTITPTLPRLRSIAELLGVDIKTLV
jgi:transcriptional regulator with XRE-family HTH domain